MPNGATSSIYPGVYVSTFSGGLPPLLPAPTAVPAFIGYTPQALQAGTSCTNVPVPITSLAEFEAIFCPSAPPPPATARPYRPQYYPGAGPGAVAPDPATVYYLYNSIRLFFLNGGSMAYVVSVGGYGPASGRGVAAGAPLVNPNVRLSDLQAGLAALRSGAEPTMYACPDAALLTAPDNAAWTQAVLGQAAALQTAVALLDVPGGRAPVPATWTADVARFRAGTGSTGLRYGAAYYPFLATSVTGTDAVDYTNLCGGDSVQLAAWLCPAGTPAAAVKAVTAALSGTTPAAVHAALLAASPTYGALLTAVLADVNLLPPSGCMAGSIALTDEQTGPWQAPVRQPLYDVAGLPIQLSGAQGGQLCAVPKSGKPVNAIRLYPMGRGVMAQSARTLDGTSPEACHLVVVRTFLFIRQTCRSAVQACRYTADTSILWPAIVSMLSGFLESVWQQGGLQGALAPEAYTVACGLGSTMTATDVQNGTLIVQVQVALAQPSHFTPLTIQVQMLPASVS